MKLMFVKGAKTALLAGTMLIGVSANGAVLFFNSGAPANNADTRTAWLAAIGIATPDLLEDFEDIPANTNINGVGGLLEGGIVISDTSGANAAYVRASNTYFGGSNPVGAQGVAHNEGTYLEISFGGGVSYVGGFDIDHTSTTVVVTYADSSTSNHVLEGTGGSGNSAEFWGFYRNDMPLITKIQMNASGDGEWGIDHLEYSTPVPEPTSMAVLALGAAALLRRKRRS